MRCKNPLDHEPHEYLADSEAATLSPCEGGPRLHTEEEVGALQAFEVQAALKSLLRNLKEVRAQRAAERISLPEGRDRQIRRMGEIWGLDTAIAAIQRRLR